MSSQPIDGSTAKSLVHSKKEKAGDRTSKRTSSPGAGSRKRRKKERSQASDVESEEPSMKLSPPADCTSKASDKPQSLEGFSRHARRKGSHVDDEPSTMRRGQRSVEEESPSDRVETSDTSKAEDAVERSESEMSELIDEAPKPKRSRKSEPKDKSKGKKRVAKPAKTSDAPTDPDTEEIKRLQGQLVKCGIRKMWFKELAPFVTPKAKIRHLKGLLEAAGLVGRFSEAKAEQIREERELRADLEAVQEGDKIWGQAHEDEPAAGRPKRRLAKSLEGLDFLNDDDGEETD